MTTQIIGRVMMAFKGNYDATTQYNFLDAVTYNGSSYVCLVNGTTTAPSDSSSSNWQLMAKAGATPDTSQFALRSELPDLSDYAKKNELPTVPTDLVHTSELQTVSETASEALDKANSNAKALMVKPNKSDIPTTMAWNSITDKPNLATKDELPNMTGYATIASLVDYVKKTDLPDFTQFATKKDIPTNIDTSGFATKEAVQQAQTTADNANKASSDNAKSISQLSTRVDDIKIPDLSGYAKQSDIPTDVVTHAELAKATPKIDDSDKTTIKKPSDYADGIFYEIKSISALSIDRSSLHNSNQSGNYGLVTTKVMTINGTKFARQQCEIMDSTRPVTFLRNGSSDNWNSWELNTTLAF